MTEWTRSPGGVGIEIGRDDFGHVLIRNGADRANHLAFAPGEFAAFLAVVKTGSFDHFVTGKDVELQPADEWGRALCQEVIRYVDTLEPVQCALTADHDGECDTLPVYPRDEAEDEQRAADLAADDRDEMAGREIDAAAERGGADPYVAESDATGRLIHAAAYTDTGRDTGHALCGNGEGSVSSDWDLVNCAACIGDDETEDDEPGGRVEATAGERVEAALEEVGRFLGRIRTDRTTDPAIDQLASAIGALRSAVSLAARLNA